MLVTLRAFFISELGLNNVSSRNFFITSFVKFGINFVQYINVLLSYTYVIWIIVRNFQTMIEFNSVEQIIMSPVQVI